MTRRRTWFAPLALAVICLASACGSSATGSSSGSSAASTPFRILAIESLTGPLAAVGTPSIQAVKAAVNYYDSIGGVGGHLIQLTVKDDGSSAATAVSLLEQALTSGPKPSMVIPGSSSNETVALLPILTKYQVLSIASTGAAEISDVSKYPYSFGGSFAADASPNAIAAYIAKQGYKMVGVLYANDAFGQPWFTLLDAALKKESVTVLPSAYAPTSLDLSPDLGKLESQHPGAIVAEGFGSPVGAIYAARVKLANYSSPFIADDTISSGNPWATAGNPQAFKNSVEEIYAVQQAGSTDAQRPIVGTMLKWVRKLGKIQAAISLYALNWDIVTDARAAEMQAGSMDTQKMTDALQSLHPSKDAQWVQNLGNPPGYTASSHFAAPVAKNYAFIPVGPLTADGQVGSAS